MFTGITIAGYDFELIRYGKYMTEDGRLDYIPNFSPTGDSYIQISKYHYWNQYAGNPLLKIWHSLVHSLR